MAWTKLFYLVPKICRNSKFSKTFNYLDIFQWYENVQHWYGWHEWHMVSFNLYWKWFDIQKSRFFWSWTKISQHYLVIHFFNCPLHFIKGDQKQITNWTKVVFTGGLVCNLRKEDATIPLLISNCKPKQPINTNFNQVLIC